jgi:RNA polymerase sigma-70 factor (ECF subfamily)
MEGKQINLSDKARLDYELVQKALEGDEKAFTRLLARYKG